MKIPKAKDLLKLKLMNQLKRKTIKPLKKKGKVYA